MHVFLKHYVAERLSGPGERPKAWHNFAVFAIAAFWHGFYPFYYVSFSMAAITQFVHKDIYQSWILFRPIPTPIRRAAAFVIAQVTINYIGLCQNAMLYANGIRFLKATYFYIPIHLIAVLIATRGFGLLRLAKKLER